jgi:Spy/CpxP family protein refolding chaperone
MKSPTRRYHPGLILSFAALLAALPAISRADDSAPSSRREKRQDTVERLADELGLSDDQRAKLKSLGDQERVELDALRADASVAKEDRRAKAGVIHQKYRALRDAILTPEQKAKADKMRENFGKRRDGEKPADK